MARLITVYWRDIPAQVIARRGRESIKVALSQRFQEAIDRAALRAGKGTSHAYLAEWRRESRGCGSDLSAEAQAEATRLESVFTEEYLKRVVKAGGVAEDKVGS
ncbi:MAG: hypothetical protein GWN09_04190 [Gammaproteobacteria bacterium]|nr:hypothetical protein [Gammaproteobacteria bacterium]